MGDTWWDTRGQGICMETAIRECKEEINIDIPQADMQLAGMLF
jgi:8-oxo-dGTP pyrophosphatase MutT (NUDIX family)